MTTLVLAVLALVLAGPVPWLLAREPRLRRTPRAAIVLWQAVALAAVLAALGAGLSVVTEQALGRRSVGSYVVALLALLVTTVVLGRLLLSGHRVGMRLRVLRRRHRDLVDVLSEDRGGVSVLEHEAPTAYCVPGFGRSRVVLSSGAYATLTQDGIDAVLAHERAHLRARHDLVVEGFTALHHAFPAVVTSAGALGEVQLLVEVLADRAARKVVDTRSLVAALGGLVSGAAPESAMSAAPTDLRARLDLLLDERSHRLQAVLVVALAVAVVVAPTVLVVVPWLQRVHG